MSNSSLTRTKNWYRCVGTVYEKKLDVVDVKVKLRDDKGKETGKTMDSKAIRGTVRVKTNYGVQDFNVYFTQHGGNGKEVTTWPMAQSMLDWNPKIGGNGDEPTLVNIEGSVEINDYVGRSGKVASTLRWRVSRASTSDIPDGTPNETALSAIVYIKNMTREVVNDKETGRLIMNTYAVNRNSECFPIRVFVDKDIADDVEDFYSPEDTVSLDLTVKTRHVGDSSPKYKHGIGKAGALKVNSGFDVTEITFNEGSEPIEEPEEKTMEDDDGNEIPVPTDWINPVAMKKAIKERAAKLEQMEKDGPTASSKSSFGRKDSALEKAKASVKSKPKDEDDHDFPPEDDVDSYFG